MAPAASANLSTILSELARSGLVFLVAVLVGFAIWVALFKLRVLAGMPVLFYRGVALVILSAALTFGLALFAVLRFGLPPSTALAAAALSASFNITFLIVFPVTIDRSVTVFLLGQMANAPARGLRPDELRSTFDRVYMGDWNQVQRRMDEQTLSGNVAPAADGAYRITDQGRSFLRFSRTVAWMFDTDPKFIDGKGPSRPAS